MKISRIVVVVVFVAVLCLGCVGKKSEDTSDSLKKKTKTEEHKKEQKKKILEFVDVFGKSYQTEILDEVKKNDYQTTCFSKDGEKMTYVGDNRYTYKLGVDVSKHQGKINWKKVKADGYEFAFLRVGFRGYGEEGSLSEDAMFQKNYKDAKKAGVKVGVYFFAQAINEAEALEEAKFVENILKGKKLDYPVVYDPENILNDKARTDDVSGEQFTKNTIAFCEAIAKAGYQPMIYGNMLWEAFTYDLPQLSKYPIWYADYESLPQTPYYYSCWQYTNKGKVNGIDGNVDLNIWLDKAK